MKPKIKPQNYKVLNPGDVRQKGDEQMGNGRGTNHDHARDWTQIGSSMIGHVILSADTMTTNFRRPL
jgi:hypothetical protein